MLILELNKKLLKKLSDVGGSNNEFYVRYLGHFSRVVHNFSFLYGEDQTIFLERLTDILLNFYARRPDILKERDRLKINKGEWFTEHDIVGMSLYVDRFCDDLNSLHDKLSYFEDLGVNLLHLMPLMQSPPKASDGGYAVSDYKKVDARLGTIEDFKSLQLALLRRNMYVMLDVVVNHTSDMHEWALKAKAGDKFYQDFFYCYDSREKPDLFEKSMPEIFPHSSPGNFTWSPEMNKWVMTVFNSYQWDLNYLNPEVLLSMVDIILYYGNIGVDILRVDAPAFIWKKSGTTCQNLEEAHRILQIFKACVEIVSPGMALLGEAIVSPEEIMKYFGHEWCKECDIAYNATQMALQWDALATGNTGVMLNSQNEISRKPRGTTWINYTRCHDDIGFGFSDEAIRAANFSPYEHRAFLKNYYAGIYEGSPARGMLFAENPKTGDARVSGTLASLCGLENALDNNKKNLIDVSIQKIVMMQANSMFFGGIPMLFYGDEIGYINDYSYADDAAKKDDNRWIHRPLINWEKSAKRKNKGSLEYSIFNKIKKIIQIRKKLSVFSDQKNREIINGFVSQIFAYKRWDKHHTCYLIFNFSSENIFFSLHLDDRFSNWIDMWSEKPCPTVNGKAGLWLHPYQFCILFPDLSRNR